MTKGKEALKKVDALAKELNLEITHYNILDKTTIYPIDCSDSKRLIRREDLNRLIDVTEEILKHLGIKIVPNTDSHPKFKVVKRTK